MKATRASTPADPAARGVWVSALVLTATLVGACASQQHAREAPTPVPRAPLRVGIAPNYPPLAFKRHGRIVGVDAQFAALLGPALQAQVSVVETPWEELIPALRAGRIDIIMSGMSITEARRELVSFTHPYLRVGQMMVLRRTDAQRLRDAAAIDQPSTRVGFVVGTTGEAYVRHDLPRARPLGFDSTEAAVAALRAGDIDVFVHDSPSIWRITAPQNDPQHQLNGRYEPLTTEYLAWAVRQDDQQLRARLDAVLTKWHTDGTLERVLAKWIRIKKGGPDTQTPRG